MWAESQKVKSGWDRPFGHFFTISSLLDAFSIFSQNHIDGVSSTEGVHAISGVFDLFG